MNHVEQNNVLTGPGPGILVKRRLVLMSRLILSFLTLAILISGALIISISIEEQIGRFILEFVTTTTIIVVTSTIAALIINRHPRHAVGWILLVTSLIFSTRLMTGATLVLFTSGRVEFAHPLMMFFGWFSWWNWVPQLMFAPIFLALYYPVGRLLSPRWRIVSLLSAVVIIVLTIGAAIEPSVSEGVLNPLVVPGAESISGFVNLIASITFIPVALLAVVSIVLRYRRADHKERTQLIWVLYPIALGLIWYVMVVPLLGYFLPNLPGAISEIIEIGAFWLISLAIPLTIGVAILRYDLFDISIIVNRTLVYGILTATIIFLYIGIVSILGILIESQFNIVSSLIATGFVAVIFQPLRERLQKIVNRFLFGQRDEPVVVLSRVAQQIENTVAPSTILPNLVQIIAQTLKIPYVAIMAIDTANGLETIAQWGKPVEAPQSIALTYDNQAIGQLLVATRSRHEQFNRNDRLLLNTIATFTATIVHSLRLSQELQLSRQRIIKTREEERRRIRRDLHDGLGPQLASQSLSLAVVSQLIKKDPDKAQSLIKTLQSQADVAIQDVRRLVYGLRPPALDDLGLVGALKQTFSRYENGDLRIDLATQDLPKELPAAIETAIFHITQEALTNVVRHSEATRCSVHLEAGPTHIHLKISDNGSGIPDNFRAGVGILAMHERAAELGGETIVASLPTGGTVVTTKIPLEAQND